MPSKQRSCGSSHVRKDESSQINSQQSVGLQASFTHQPEEKCGKLKLSADNILQHPEEIKYRRVIIALLAISSHPLTQLSHEIVTLNDTIKLVPRDKLDSKSQ